MIIPAADNPRGRAFVTTVMMALGPLDRKAEEHVKDAVQRMFVRGYDCFDAILEVFCYEEVNPDLPEAVANERLKQIRAKYDKPAEWTLKSEAEEWVA